MKNILFLLAIPIFLVAQGGPAYHIGSGPTLPALCSPLSGDIFTKTTTGPSAGVLYTCTATNTWTATSGSTGPAGPTGPTGPAGAAGSGNNAICTSASGSGATYTCTGSPTVTSLTGLIITFTPDVTNTSSAPTVNVSGLGALTLTGADGTTTIPLNYFVPGTKYIFSHVGSVFTQTTSCANPITGVVWVACYGATGNGTTDDRVAVQAAINAAGSGTVCFSAGTYLMNSFFTDTASDSWNLTETHSGSALSACGGNSGSVTIIQGSSGATNGGTRVYMLGIIAAPYLTSSVGANGYQNITQNGGYYTLNAVTANSNSVTFTTVSQAGNFAKGDWIFVAQSNSQSTNPVVPGETHKVVSSNASTGVVTFEDLQMVAFPSPAYAAKVNNLTVSHVKIDGLTLQGAVPLLLNSIYDLTISNTQLIADHTYASSGVTTLIANAVKKYVFRDSRFTCLTLDSTCSNMKSPENNSRDGLWDKDDVAVPVFGAGEYLENITFRDSIFSMFGDNCLQVQGLKIHWSGNRISCSGVSGQPDFAIADSNGAPNTYSWPFGQVVIDGDNKITSGPDIGVFIGLPDTVVAGNTFFTTGAPAIFDQHGATTQSSNSIQGNVLYCYGVSSPYGCAFLQGSTVDGVNFTGNFLIGASSANLGLNWQSPGSPSTGIATVAANGISGFTAAFNVVASYHPNSIIIQSGVLQPFFPNTGGTITGTTTIEAPTANQLVLVDTTVGGGIRGLEIFEPDSSNSEVCSVYDGQLFGGKQWALCANGTGSGLPGIGSIYDNTDGTYSLSWFADGHISALGADFRGGATFPEQSGLTASKPSTCSVGQVYFATDATAGQNQFFCTATNTWTQQLNSGGSGGGISFTGIPTATAIVTAASSSTIQTPSSTATV